MNDTYTQVVLIHLQTHKVCWIPSNYAVKGKILTLPDSNRHWTVLNVYSDVRTAEELRDMRAAMYDMRDILKA